MSFDQYKGIRLAPKTTTVLKLRLAKQRYELWLVKLNLFLLSYGGAISDLITVLMSLDNKLI